MKPDIYIGLTMEVRVWAVNQCCPTEKGPVVKMKVWMKRGETRPYLTLPEDRSLHSHCHKNLKSNSRLYLVCICPQG
jgi:hypothetical protein